MGNKSGNKQFFLNDLWLETKWAFVWVEVKAEIFIMNLNKLFFILNRGTGSSFLQFFGSMEVDQQEGWLKNSPNNIYF